MLNAGDAKSVATQVAVMVYEKIEEKITGIAYSKDEKERLRVLKDTYKATFKTEPPVLWNLDEKDQPTHRIKTSDVALHIEQLRHDKASLGPFHYYIDGILEFAATYLKERSERGALTRGKPGDVLEQFLTEFIHWAVNDLPTYIPNTESVLRLRQRIDYLDRILKSENLFKFGTFARSKNKAETINNLKLTLEACLHYAEHEAERLNARDKLIVLKQETERLLLGCVNTLYYVRGTPVQTEPLRLESFIQTATASEHLGRLYTTIQGTHTGALLCEVIELSGLTSFGAGVDSRVIADVKETKEYFGTEGRRQSIVWQSRKTDAPPWVGKEGEQPFVVQLHDIGEATIRVAKLKTLIESAYDLTGKAGDLWAYGDEQGKASLEVLLYLLSSELEQLMCLLRTLHSEQNTARHHYNMSRRIDQDKGVNPNFNKFDHHFAHCTESETRLNAAMTDINRQMRTFPVDAAKRINEQKQKFYRDLAGYMSLYHPSVASRFPRLVMDDDSKGSLDGRIDSKATVTNTSTKTTATSAALFGIEGTLRLPVATVGSFLVLQHDTFQAYALTIESAPLKSWSVGDDYTDWAQGFMTRQATVIVRYHETTDRLLALKSPQEFKTIEQLGHLAKQDLATLQQQLEYTRPKWRFRWSLWPIETAGWPFNRAARLFAEALGALINNTLTELKQRLAFMQATMLVATPSASTPVTDIIPIPAPLPSESKLLAPLATPIMSSPVTVGGTAIANVERSSTMSTAALTVHTPAPPSSALDLRRRAEEEKAEFELEAYITAKNDATEQKRLVSSFVRDLNREFEDPRQALFERMNLDLRRDRVLRLLAVATISPTMQQACQEIITLLNTRCDSSTVALSVLYRRQAAFIKCLLAACTTTEPAARIEARKTCLREFEAYTLYISTQALVSRSCAISPSIAVPTSSNCSSIPQLP